MSAAEEYAPHPVMVAGVNYARSGLRVFPVVMAEDRTDGKRPKEPPYGYDWDGRASSNVSTVVQDIEDAASRYGWDALGIAWAVGLDGCVALDLDVPTPPDWWPEVEAAGHALNVTAKGRHLIYRNPESVTPGNGTSRFPTTGWGEVRGRGGYVVVWGPDRPGFDVNELNKLGPFPRPDWLTQSGATADAADPERVAAFIAEHTEARKPSGLDGVRTWLTNWKNLTPEERDARKLPNARHDAAVHVSCWLAREAAAGWYAASDGFDVLRKWWDEVHPDDARRRNGPELGYAIAWGIAQAEAAPDRLDELRAEVTRGVSIATPDDESGRPELVVSGRHLNEIADELVGHLVASNDPPALFAHAEAVSVLHSTSLRTLDADRLLNEIERRTRPVKWERPRKAEDAPKLKPATVTVDARKLTLMRLGERLPALTGLAVAPFLRRDGTVCSTPGYDPAERLYLLDGLDVAVPDAPTAAEIAAAVALVDELLYDFPLATPTDRAHAFSALLTPAVRHLVPVAPLHYFNGNSMGVGKNLLAEVLAGIHLGYRMETDPLPADEEEMRKQITAHLAEGRRIVMWDEAHYLIGRQLARLLTSARWSDRVLGANVTINAENMLTTFALGNNGEIVGDLRRRVVRIDLTTRLVAPSLRSGFRHPDLRAWADEHRPALLSAVLTLLRAWHCAGRPGVASPLGSFEAWTHIVGGTLAVAGVDGFLGNVTEVLEDGDSRDAEMAAHLADLVEMFGAGVDFTAGDVLGRCRADRLDTLPASIRIDAADAADRLGKLYRQYRQRPMPGGLLLERAGTTHGRTRWRVARGGHGGDGWASAEAETSLHDAAALSEREVKTQCVGIAIPAHPHPSPPSEPKPAAHPLRRCPTCALVTFDPDAGRCMAPKCQPAEAIEEAW
jgi:hypothetical protein